jgi:DNA-binding transcriptional LysR family regulator
VTNEKWASQFCSRVTLHLSLFSTMPNVHHLELFYYVARHRGISEAARRIPYGIQQPAISGQMTQLEASLGVPLFLRRPFSLTPAGKRLYEFIFPFFSQVDDLAAELKDADSAHLRLGASSSTLAKHLPTVLNSLREVFPKLKLTLREVPSADSLKSLQSGEIDVALTVRPPSLPTGMEFLELLALPLVLLVSEKSKYKTLNQLLVDSPTNSGLKISKEPLISLPEEEPLARLFQEALRERNILWDTQMEVSSADLAAPYAAAGFGVALYIEVPGIPCPAGVRVIKLTGFPSLAIGLVATSPPKSTVMLLAKLCLKKVREFKLAKAD